MNYDLSELLVYETEHMYEEGEAARLLCRYDLNGVSPWWSSILAVHRETKKFVGVASVSGGEPGISSPGELRYLYVSEEWRRRGVAARLLRMFFSAPRTIWVFTANNPARRFCEWMGYYVPFEGLPVGKRVMYRLRDSLRPDDYIHTPGFRHDYSGKALCGLECTPACGGDVAQERREQLQTGVTAGWCPACLSRAQSLTKMEWVWLIEGEESEHTGSRTGSFFVRAPTPVGPDSHIN